jgi:hypothetical protein
MAAATIAALSHWPVPSPSRDQERVQAQQGEGGHEPGPEQPAQQLGHQAAGPDRDQADPAQQDRGPGQLGRDPGRRDRGQAGGKPPGHIAWVAEPRRWVSS